MKDLSALVDTYGQSYNFRELPKDDELESSDLSYGEPPEEKFVNILSKEEWISWYNNSDEYLTKAFDGEKLDEISLSNFLTDVDYKNEYGLYYMNKPVALYDGKTITAISEKYDTMDDINDIDILYYVFKVPHKMQTVDYDENFVAYELEEPIYHPEYYVIRYAKFVDNV